METLVARSLPEQNQQVEERRNCWSGARSPPQREQWEVTQRALRQKPMGGWTEGLRWFLGCALAPLRLRRWWALCISLYWLGASENSECFQQHSKVGHEGGQETRLPRASQEDQWQHVTGGSWNLRRMVSSNGFLCHRPARLLTQAFVASASLAGSTQVFPALYFGPRSLSIE